MPNPPEAPASELPTRPGRALSYVGSLTPHLFVVDAAGRLAYQGGIDDKPTANVDDIKTARNHVTAALGELRAGRPVSQPETRPYGCSVKYPES